VANAAPTCKKENHCRSAVTDLVTDCSRPIHVRQAEGRGRTSNMGWTVLFTYTQGRKEAHSKDEGKNAPDDEESLPWAGSP
jgi:hypothetical protein